jgi:colicin import membrane protein
MAGFTAIATGVGALANVAGGVIGGMASSSDRAAAAAASQKALKEIEAIGAPPDVAREILLREYKSAGVLTPEVEKQVDLGVSQVSQIKEAPELREAQMGALKRLQEASKAGFTPEARAVMQEARTQAQRDAQAKMQQILQQQQARGLAGAGSTLAAQLQAGSAAAAEEGEAAIKTGAAAAQAALSAAAQSGQLGSSIRGQEFDIARTKAGAEDQFALQRFNEAVSRQQRDVSARNIAQQANLAQQQRILDMNVAQRNAELQRQRQAEADRYRMEMQRAGMRAGAYSGEAQQRQQQAAQTQQGWSQIGQGFGGAAMAAGQYAQDRADRAADTALKEKELRLKYGEPIEPTKTDYSGGGWGSNLA